ncbi:efflux RND transporter periplasmic adaptor subunit [Thauera sp. JM12B12]|uniref:efflux RND transporter periplasmic adaptor subunit n=1 Tax=Thauera sp. JM12B12 TaxID=3142262 RepID=UPI0031F3A8AA
MSSRRPLIIAVCIAGLAGLAGYAWHANQPHAGGAGAPRVGAPPQAAGGGGPGAPVAVEVAVVQARTLADDVSAVGTLVSNESVVLRPEVSGRIEAIRFRDGEAVRRGAILVELDAAVQRAELQQARANLTLAESNFRRTQDLFGRKFVSQSSLDDARAKLEVARASLALAQAHLARMQIRAPFDGVVGIRSVSPGDFVKDGDALINLEDIATLKVDFRLPELYLDRVRAGQALELSSDVLPGARVAATVEAIDPLVDAQGRAVRLRASLANPALRLRPGVFVRVRLILGERAAVPVVPEAALVPAPGNTQFVYRVDDGKVKRVEVRTGQRRQAVVEVVEGLEAGAVVVTAGQLKLRDGAAVNVAGAPAGVARAD